MFFCPLPFTKTSVPNTDNPRRVIVANCLSLVLFARKCNLVTLSHPSPAYRSASSGPPFGGTGATRALDHFKLYAVGRMTGESSLLQKLSLKALDTAA